jgi:hypothetical protein
MMPTTRRQIVRRFAIAWLATSGVVFGDADPSPEWAEIRRSEAGRVKDKVRIDLSLPAHKDLRDAMERSAKKSRSEQADFNSYAPNLVLQTDLFRIDFRETRVVLSRRESKQAVWSQTSRKRSGEDRVLESLVLNVIADQKTP